MSDTTERIEFKLVESEELFWENLREISDRLGWETDQTLKACFALGWDQLTQNRLLKATEVAQILNISRAMAYKLMQSNSIPIVIIGSSKRVRPVDLNKYIRDNLKSANKSGVK